jgi:hypothetical protein
MSPDEQTLIQGLFDRLRQVENQPRDPEAERLIQDSLRGQPGAPYYMAQAIIVQEQALQAAQTQIEELQRQVSELQSGGARQQAPGGFLSSVAGGLFGASRNAPQRPSSVPLSGSRHQPMAPAAQPYAAQPYSAQPPTPAQMAQMQPQAQSGGFLKSAMATAAGVAGGALLFQGISSMFGGQHHHANPWSAAPSQTAASGSGSGFNDDNSRLAEAEQALVDDQVDYGGDDFGGDSMDI